VNSDPLRRRAIAALVIVNLLWGISFPAMKATNLIMERHQASATSTEPTVPSHAVAKVVAASFFMTVRFAAALVLLGLLVPRLFVGLTAEQWLMGAWTGLAFSAGFLLQIVGLNYIPASRSGFLTSLAVVFTPLLGIVFDRRAPRLPVAGGAVLALLGTAVLTGVLELGGPGGLRLAQDAFARVGPGDWLTTLAAFIFAIQIVLIDRFSRRMPAGRLTPGMFAATLAVGGAAFLAGQVWQPSSGGLAVWSGLLMDAPFLLLVLLMSLLCTVLAFHWMNKYQAHVSPAHAALIYTLEPIFATAWAMLLPGLISRLIDLSYPSERPGLELVVGGLLVVAGNALALWPTGRPS